MTVLGKRRRLSPVLASLEDVAVAWNWIELFRKAGRPRRILGLGGGECRIK